MGYGVNFQLGTRGAITSGFVNKVFIRLVWALLLQVVVFNFQGHHSDGARNCSSPAPEARPYPQQNSATGVDFWYIECQRVPSGASNWGATRAPFSQPPSGTGTGQAAGRDVRHSHGASGVSSGAARRPSSAKAVGGKFTPAAAELRQGSPAAPWQSSSAWDASGRQPSPRGRNPSPRRKGKDKGKGKGKSAAKGQDGKDGKTHKTAKNQAGGPPAATGPALPPLPPPPKVPTFSQTLSTAAAPEPSSAAETRLETLLETLRSSRDSLPPHVVNLLGENEMTAAQQHAKALHRAVSAQNTARKELHKVQQARRSYLASWSAYVEQLQGLLSTQMKEQEKALTDFQVHGDKWQTQLRDATKSLAELSVDAPSRDGVPTVLLTSGSDMEDSDSAKDGTDFWQALDQARSLREGQQELADALQKAREKAESAAQVAHRDQSRSPRRKRESDIKDGRDATSKDKGAKNEPPANAPTGVV